MKNMKNMLLVTALLSIGMSSAMAASSAAPKTTPATSSCLDAKESQVEAATTKTVPVKILISEAWTNDGTPVAVYQAAATSPSIEGAQTSGSFSNISSSHQAMSPSPRPSSIIQSRSITPATYRSSSASIQTSPSLHAMSSPSSHSPSTNTTTSSKSARATVSSPMFLTTTPSPSPSPSITTATSTPHSETTKQIRRILVVDDDESNLKMARHIMKKIKEEMEKSHSREEWVLTTAVNGPDAITIIKSTIELKQSPIDVILMDYHMPHGYGDVITHRIRTELKLSQEQLPILGFTTNADDKKIYEACLKAGMNKVLKKPMGKDLWIKEISEALDAKDARIENEIAEEGRSLLDTNTENTENTDPGIGPITRQLIEIALKQKSEQKDAEQKKADDKRQ